MCICTYKRSYGRGKHILSVIWQLWPTIVTTFVQSLSLSRHFPPFPANMLLVRFSSIGNLKSGRPKPKLPQNVYIRIKFHLIFARTRQRWLFKIIGRLFCRKLKTTNLKCLKYPVQQLIH